MSAVAQLLLHICIALTFLTRGAHVQDNNEPVFDDGETSNEIQVALLETDAAVSSKDLAESGSISDIAKEQSVHKGKGKNAHKTKKKAKASPSKMFSGSGAEAQEEAMAWKVAHQSESSPHGSSKASPHHSARRHKKVAAHKQSPSSPSSAATPAAFHPGRSAAADSPLATPGLKPPTGNCLKESECAAEKAAADGMQVAKAALLAGETLDEALGEAKKTISDQMAEARRKTAKTYDASKERYTQTQREAVITEKMLAESKAEMNLAELEKDREAVDEGMALISIKKGLKIGDNIEKLKQQQEEALNPRTAAEDSISTDGSPAEPSAMGQGSGASSSAAGGTKSL